MCMYIYTYVYIYIGVHECFVCMKCGVASVSYKLRWSGMFCHAGLTIGLFSSLPYLVCLSLYHCMGLFRCRLYIGILCTLLWHCVGCGWFAAWSFLSPPGRYGCFVVPADVSV